MGRMNTARLGMLASVLCFFLPTCVAHAQSAPGDRRAGEVQSAFINALFAGRADKINLLKIAEPLNLSESDRASCSALNLAPLSGEHEETIALDGEALGRVHLLNSKEDVVRPEALNDKGSTIRQELAADIWELSAVAFSKSGDTAVLRYGHHCGVTCGNGGLAIFERTARGWARSMKSCGSVRIS